MVEFASYLRRVLCSLRSKRFRAVSEQRKTEERDSRFLARKQHGNACYAGHVLCKTRLIFPRMNGPIVSDLYTTNVHKLAS